MRAFITIPLLAAIISLQPILAMADHKRSSLRSFLSGNRSHHNVSFQNRAFHPRQGTQFLGASPQGFSTIGHHSMGYQPIAQPGIGFQSIGHSPIGQPTLGHPGLGYPGMGYHPEEVEATVRQWYVTYLGREPEPAAYMNWVNSVFHGSTLSEVQVGILSSPEFFARGHNDPERYVQLIFRLTVGRDATPRELQTWVSMFFQTYHGERTQFTRDLLMSLGLY